MIQRLMGAVTDKWVVGGLEFRRFFQNLFSDTRRLDTGSGQALLEEFSFSQENWLMAFAAFGKLLISKRRFSGFAVNPLSYLRGSRKWGFPNAS